MKYLKKICVVILTLTFVFAPAASYASTMTAQASKPIVSSKIGRPVISAKSVNDSYIKISWKKCTGASKYEVYRSTQSNGTYKKIYTTSKSYYNDKTVKNETKYFYKVRSINSKGTYCSKYSSKKNATVHFEGIIEPEEATVLFFTTETTTNVRAVSCDDELIASTDYKWTDVSVEREYGNNFVITLDRKIWSVDAEEYEITLKFKNHKNVYSKKIKVYQNMLVDPKYHYNYAPSFGPSLLLSPVKYDSANDFFVYSYSDIYDKWGVSGEVAVTRYIEGLKRYADLYSRSYNKYGGTDYIFTVKDTGDKFAISDAPNMPGGSVVGIAYK